MNTCIGTDYHVTLSKLPASKQLRRLKGKKQVFSLLVPQTSSKADYIHERLLHTLEVCSVAKEIIKKICRDDYYFTTVMLSGLKERLEYSEELLEAIAYAHDFGHTPFGHIGEQALTHYMQGKNATLRSFKPKSTKHGTLVFKHNYYSAALLARNFSPCSSDIIDGVLKHTKVDSFDGVTYKYKNVFGAHSYLPEDLRKKDGYLDSNVCYTLEGQVVAMADEVAQMLSDLEDSNSILKKLFTEEDQTNTLLKKPNQTMKDYLSGMKEKLIASLIIQSRNNIQTYLSKHHITNRVVYFTEQVVDFDDATKQFFSNLEKMRKQRLHGNEKVVRQNCLSYLIIFKIFDHYLEKPSVLFQNDYKCFYYILNNFIKIRDDSHHRSHPKKITRYLAFCDYLKNETSILNKINSLRSKKYDENASLFRKKYIKKMEAICKRLGKYYFDNFGDDRVMDSLSMSLMREISFSIGKMTDNYAVDVFLKAFKKDIKRIDKYIDKCCSAKAVTAQYSIEKKYAPFFKNRLFVLKTCLTTMDSYNKV